MATGWSLLAIQQPPARADAVRAGCGPVDAGLPAASGAARSTPLRCPDGSVCKWLAAVEQLAAAPRCVLCGSALASSWRAGDPGGCGWLTRLRQQPQQQRKLYRRGVWWWWWGLWYADIRGAYLTAQARHTHGSDARWVFDQR